MMEKWWRGVCSVLVRMAPVLLLLCGSMVSAQTLSYVVIDLGTLPGHSFSIALGVNDAGKVVGGSDGRAFLWADGLMEDLGTLPGGDCGGCSSLAWGINNSDQAVGESYTRINGSYFNHAFLWQNDVMQDLGTLGGDFSHAFAVNDNGVVVGEAMVASGDFHAFRWSNGTMQDLGVLSGGFSSSALSINESGQIVGFSDNADGWTRAVLWQGGTIYDLGTLPNRENSIATSINNSGQVVGYSFPSVIGLNTFRAFIWQSGVMTDLNELIPPGSGWLLTFAYGINDNGQIVGEGLHNGARRAFLYQDGEVVDLTDATVCGSSCVLYTARGINNLGQIVGGGVFGSASHGFLLSPVRLMDAQGFQPALDNDVPVLSSPITNVVDSSFDRVGSLTDGASLVVVQLAVPGLDMTGWSVTLTNLNHAANAPAALGSLWHGDNTSLPPLPATLSDPGTITITLGADETAFFYRAAPSWAFGKETKEHDIQIQVFDQSNNVVAAVPFTLRKPPLVLVHGLFGSSAIWRTFEQTLAASNIVVDTSEADYKVCNTCGFDTIFNSVPEAIRIAVGDSRENRIAATRVDVVGHSMGGNATRWYMTPSSQIPDGLDRAVDGPVFFKTTTISAVRAEEDEFVRPDNFGIGDIRRFISLGTPHTGSPVAWRGILFLNDWVATGRSERRKEHRKDTAWFEDKLGFVAIGLNEPGNPTSHGMAIVDLAAFGTHPSEANAGIIPPRSVALNIQAPIPVKYLPVEATALTGSLGTDLTTLLTTKLRDIVLRKLSDVQPDNSDTVVPALSARNLTQRRDTYNVTGIAHGGIPNSPKMGWQFFADLLGPDDSMFLGPDN